MDSEAPEANEETTSENDKAEEGSEENSTANEQNSEEDSKDESAEESSSIFDFSGLGQAEIIKHGTGEAIGNTMSIGPMEFSVNHVALIELETSQEAKDYYLDEPADQVKLLAVDVEATNTTEDDVSFYPGSYLTTDSGEQLESDMMFSTWLGDDFLGDVSMGGTMYYVLSDAEAEVSEVTYIIDAPYDYDDMDDLAEEERYTFPLEEGSGNLTQDDLEVDTW